MKREKRMGGEEAVETRKKVKVEEKGCWRILENERRRSTYIYDLRSFDC